MTPLWIFKDIGTLKWVISICQACHLSAINAKPTSQLHSTHLFISSCRCFMLVCTNFGLGFVEKSLSTIWTSAMNFSLTESNFHKVLCLKIKSYRLPIVISQKKKEISWLNPFWGNGRKTRHNLSCLWKSIYSTFNCNTILYPATCKHIK